LREIEENLWRGLTSKEEENTIMALGLKVS